MLEADLPRAGAPVLVDALFANRSGSAGRPGGICGLLSTDFLSIGTDGLLGKSGLSRDCRSDGYGRTLGGRERSEVKFLGAR